MSAILGIFVLLLVLGKLNEDKHSASQAVANAVGVERPMGTPSGGAGSITEKPPGDGLWTDKLPYEPRYEGFPASDFRDLHNVVMASTRGGFFCVEKENLVCGKGNVFLVLHTDFVVAGLWTDDSDDRDAFAHICEAVSTVLEASVAHQIPAVVNYEHRQFAANDYSGMRTLIHPQGYELTLAVMDQPHATSALRTIGIGDDGYFGRINSREYWLFFLRRTAH